MKLRATYGLALLPFLAANETSGPNLESVAGSFGYIECTDDSDCYNGGVCEPRIVGSFYFAVEVNVCRCDLSHSGMFCQLDNNNLPCNRAENENVCQNGSTCKNDPYEVTVEGEGTFQCVCPLNYTGENCEIELGIDFKCDDSPCQNGNCYNEVINKETREEVYPHFHAMAYNQYLKNKSYCIDYECERDYPCACSPFSDWEGKNCDIYIGHPCKKEMVTFEDQQNCMNFLYEKIENIGDGKFTNKMEKSIKKQIKKKAGKNDKN